MKFLVPRSFGHKQPGFTLVELLIVIVAIATLSVLAIVAYRGVQQKTALSIMSTDLRGAAEAFELYKFDTGSYPTTMPTNIKASRGVVLSATATTGDEFCINAYYSSDPKVRVSWNSEIKGTQSHLCKGLTIGVATGGSIPAAPRGVNLMPGFSQWTLTGTASYDEATGELTLGSNGNARSPVVRVDQPRLLYSGGDMYATTASPYATLTPNGGYHVGIFYYGSDGVTAVTNSSGTTSNGVARSFTLNAWRNGQQTSGFNGGPNVIQARYYFYSTASGYASPDLKIKNPLLIVVD